MHIVRQVIKNIHLDPSPPLVSLHQHVHSSQVAPKHPLALGQDRVGQDAAEVDLDAHPYPHQTELEIKLMKLWPN